MQLNRNRISWTDIERERIDLKLWFIFIVTA
jgi:hypothetical protein